MSTTIQAIPKIYETEGIKPEDKIVHQVWCLKSHNFVWCVVEIDEVTLEAFGYANLNDNQMAEWGYIDIKDIIKNGAELLSLPCKKFKDVLAEDPATNGAELKLQ